MWKTVRKPSTGTIIKCVTIFLVAAFVLSALITGTFAWTSFSQSALNEQSGTAETIVRLLKLEKDADGTPTGRVLPGAEFYLYKISTREGEADTQIGGQYITNEEGAIPVSGLAPGGYYFLETRPGTRHSFDLDENNDPITRYAFIIDGSEENDDIVVTAYNRVIEGSLTVKKFVKNGDDTPPTAEQLAEEFVFTVTLNDIQNGPITAEINGVEYILSIIDSKLSVILHHGDTITFPDIPAGTVYRVIETPKSGYVMSSENHSGTIPEEGIEAVFTNTYFEELDTEGTLTVTKQITGTDADMSKQFDFTVTFTGDAEHTVPDPVQYRINDGAIQNLGADGRFTLGHDDSITFLNLPEGLIYTVTEDDYIPDAYIPNHREYTGTISNGNILLPFANFYAGGALPRDDYGFLQITKQVDGTGADPEQLFTFIVMLTGGAIPNPVLYRIDGGAAIQLPPDGRIQLKHGQTAVFEPLPHGTSYTIVEEPVQGYTSSTQRADGIIAEFQTSHVVFVNETITDPPEIPDATIIIRKEVSGEVSTRHTDKEYHFKLLIDGEVHEFTLKDGESVTFDNIPAGAVYELLEDDYSGEGFDQRITGGYGTANGGTIEIIQTNTFIRDVEVTIEGEKTWNLNGYTPTLPASIFLTLKNGNTVVDTVIVTPGPDGKWLYTWDVPKYEADGVTEIQYTVEETPIDGWSSVVTGYNIHNTYIPPLVLSDPPVRKVIEGDPPESATVFRFVMTARDGAPMPAGSQDGSKVVSVTGAGEIEFGDISYTEPGTYVYTISEVNSGETGYTYDESIYIVTVVIEEENGALVMRSRTITKDGATVNQAVFTNRYEKDPVDPVHEKIPIIGSKTWEHGGNTQENYPETITVIIRANGTIVMQRAVTADDDWAWSFTLDKYDANGNEIIYTIDEASVPGYTRNINGYNITNTYNPGGTDAPDPTDGPGGTNDPNNPTDPTQTGDRSNIWLWVMLMIFSLAGIIVTVKAGRKTVLRPETGHSDAPDTALPSRASRKARAARHRKRYVPRHAGIERTEATEEPDIFSPWDELLKEDDAPVAMNIFAGQPAVVEELWLTTTMESTLEPAESEDERPLADNPGEYVTSMPQPDDEISEQAEEYEPSVIQLEPDTSDDQTTTAEEDDMPVVESDYMDEPLVAEQDRMAEYRQEMDTLRSMISRAEYHTATEKIFGILTAGYDLPDSELQRIKILLRLLEEKGK